MSGLYSLILLVLLAELNFKDPLYKAWQLFLGILVICQIVYIAYYILLETITAFQEKKQLYEQKYMQQLIIFAGIICIWKLHNFISQIEAFRSDFNKVVTQSQTGTYEYITQNKAESFEFYIPETKNTLNSDREEKQ